MKFLLWFLVPCFSMHLVKFLLGYNFGQKIFDFSGAGRDGLVENESSAVSTDRGLYFTGKNHGVSIPSFTLPDQSSIIFWLMFSQGSGLIFDHGDSSSFLNLFKTSNELGFLTSSQTQETTDLCLADSKWVLIILKRNFQEFVLSSSLCANKISFTHPGIFTWFHIGGKPSNKSFKGFLWYFSITHDLIGENDLINPSPSVYSTIGNPIFCESSFKDPFYGELCISSETGEFKDAFSSDCGLGIHCSGQFIYNCNCAGYCFYNLVSLTASCSVTDCPGTLVVRDSKCCNQECGSCLADNFCTSCIDPLTEVISGSCYCKTGYFGSASNNNTTGCFPCQNSCLECESFEICLKCKSPSIFQLGKCVCDVGFFMVKATLDTFQCVACPDGCSSCDANECLSCFDSNAHLVKGFCMCHETFYGSPQRKDGSSGCLKCSSNCKTCSDFQVCSSCLDQNSEAVGGLCKCREGFFIDSSSQSFRCLECHEDCKSCKNKETCETCLAINSKPALSGGCECLSGYFNQTSSNFFLSCQKCPDLCTSCVNKTKCLSCLGENTELKNGSCLCKSGYYLKSTNFTDCISCSKSLNQNECTLKCSEGTVLKDGQCLNCGSLCKQCDSDFNCLECTINSVKLKESCKCKKGFKQVSNYCKASSFSASVKVLSNNTIVLAFQKELETELSQKILKLKIKAKNRKISLSKKNPNELLINLNEQIYFKDSTKFILFIAEPIYSSDGSVIENYYYEGVFNPYVSSNFAQKTKTSFQIIMATTFISSLCSNPVAFWVFVNTVQVIFYMPLANLDFSNRILEFIRAIGGYSLIPNYFLDLFDPEESSAPNQRQESIGIYSTLLWINIGPNFLILFLYLVMIPVFWIGSRVSFTSVHCKKQLKNYRYSVFFRFFIECFLEFGLFAMIQLQSVFFIKSGNNEFQGLFNLISAIILIVTDIQVLFGVFPLFTVVLLFKLREKMQNPEILSKFGSFYDEFKENSSFSSVLFYPIFLVRRSQYVLTQLFLSSIPKIQLLINIIFSFIQLSYVIYSKCFKEKQALFSQIIGDLTILILFCISGFYLSSIEDRTNYIIDIIFISIIIFCVGVQTLLSLVPLGKKILNLIKGCRRSKGKETISNSSKIFPIPNSLNASNIDIQEKILLNTKCIQIPNSPNSSNIDNNERLNLN